MNLAQAKLVIRQNAVTSSEWSDSSFVGRLHEGHFWDETSFDLLSEAVLIVANMSPPDQALREMCFDIYDYVMGVALLCHALPDDLSRIENIEDSQFFDIREQTETLFVKALGSKRRHLFEQTNE